MPSELGSFIRERRTAAGLGLRELARRIGKSAPFLTQLERDDMPPPASEETLTAIAKELAVNVDELFARANKLPKALAPQTAVEVALFRRMKAMSAKDQERYLEMLKQKKPRGQKG